MMKRFFALLLAASMLLALAACASKGDGAQQPQPEQDTQQNPDPDRLRFRFLMYTREFRQWRNLRHRVMRRIFFMQIQNWLRIEIVQSIYLYLMVLI